MSIHLSQIIYFITNSISRNNIYITFILWDNLPSLVQARRPTPACSASGIIPANTRTLRERAYGCRHPYIKKGHVLSHVLCVFSFLPCALSQASRLSELRLPSGALSPFLQASSSALGPHPPRRLQPIPHCRSGGRGGCGFHCGENDSGIPAPPPHPGEILSGPRDSMPSRTRSEPSPRHR